MKKIKNNQSGFTLVELIVVIALMSIVFGALMNIIKPVNQFFSDTEAFKDEVMISEGLTDALASEVRFATNVVVLKNYVGVPKLDSEGQIAGIPDVKFDSAIMIDNERVRGSLDKDFLSNRTSTVARTKGATGQIIRFEIGGIGVNFNVSDILAGEDYYSDYQYSFDVSGKTDENGRSYIDFGVTMNDLVQSDGDWVINEDNYTSSEFLYLKNINLKDDDGYTMYVKDFANSTNNDDYIKFERTPASNATASTDAQRAIFNGSDSSNSHTWILYFKGGSINAGNPITLTFDPGKGGFEPIKMTGYVGKAFNQVPPTFPEPGYDNFNMEDKRFTRRFVGWQSTIYPTDEPLTNEEIMAYIPLENETFKAVYSEADATYNVTFYDATGSEIKKIENILHGTDISDMVPTAISIPDDYMNFIWKNKGSVNDIVKFDAFDSITSDYELEPYFYNWKNIRFYKEDGGLVSDELVMSGCALDNSLIPPVPEKAGYTGEWVVYNDDGTTSYANFDNITESFDVYPKYTEIPVDKPILVANASIYSDWGNGGQMSITVTNDGTAPATGYVVRVELNGPFTYVDMWGNSATAAIEGQTLVLTYTNELAIGGSTTTHYQFNYSSSPFTIVNVETTDVTY